MKQAENVVYMSKGFETYEQANKTLSFFETSIIEATENKIAAVNVLDINDLPVILTKNILMNSITSLVKKANENEEK